MVDVGREADTAKGTAIFSRSLEAGSYLCKTHLAVIHVYVKCKAPWESQ